MHNPLPVRFIECIGNLNSITQQIVLRKRSVAQACRKRFTFHILHHQKVGSVLLADVVQRANVWMIQAGNRPSFAFESLAQIGIGR
jgi:hypothetical protein